MRNYVIRKMTLTDYDEIYKLWVNTEGVGVRDADSEHGIRLFLERNPNLSYVAMIDDKIVGTIMAGHDGRRGSIQHLVVSPSAQGLGIAKSLVNQSLTALKDVGILKSHIHVFSSNVTGQEFWTHIGWTERKDLKTFSFINSGNSNV